MGKDDTSKDPGQILPHLSDKALENLRDTAKDNASNTHHSTTSRDNDAKLADVAQQILDDRKGN